MAEENAFDEIFRDGAAVDRDERAADAIAFALDGARDQLFADAAFAFDQYWNVRCGGALPKRDHALHGIAAHHEIAERQRPLDLFLDAIDFARERFDLQRALDRNLKPFGRRRLDDEIDSAAAHGVDCRFDRAVRRLHDDRRHALGMADTLEHGHPVDAGHDEIEENERNRLAILAFKNLEGLLARTAGLGLESEPLDRLFENTSLGRIVIDDQNTLGHGHATLHLLILTPPRWSEAGIDPASDIR